MLSPAAGRWTLAILFAPTVSGTAFSEPFTVAVNQAAARVNATGCPAATGSMSTTRRWSKIQVTNTGTAPEAYFVDGRTDAHDRTTWPSLDLGRRPSR